MAAEAPITLRELAGIDVGRLRGVGEVTQAVRDTNTSIGEIVAGEWIGLSRRAGDGSGNADGNLDGIVTVGDSVEDASTALLDQLLTSDRELLTIITGADAVPATTAELESWLDEHRPDVQVEIHKGGQPLYPYLFGVE